MAEKTGKVVQVIGPVLDVEFDVAHLPEIYNALSLATTNEAGQEIELVAEVQQHIGRGQVRAVSMSSTDGVTRGMDVTDTGSSITVTCLRSSRSNSGGACTSEIAPFRMSITVYAP